MHWDAKGCSLFMQTCQQSLKVAKDEVDSKEHIFSKELATAQKLYTLYKDSSEERSRKVTELEGIIRELQKHLEVMSRTSEMS